MIDNNTLIIIKILLVIITILLVIIIIYFYNNNLKELFFEWNNCNLLDQKKLINTYEKNGVIIIPNFFSDEDCNKLLSILKKANISNVSNENATTTIVNSSYKRKNIVLPINESKKYIMKIYNKMRYFLDVLTPNPILIDCAAFITNPGCYPQVWHTDTGLDKINDIEELKYSNNISIGVALEDIDETLGPLEAILGTHKLNHDKIDMLLKTDNIFENYDIDTNIEKTCIHKNYDIKRGLCKSSIEELLKLDNRYKYVKCICKKGSLVIWSSKVFHRGGANDGIKDRSVFYITLMGNDGQNPMNFESTIENSKKKIYIKDL